MNRFHYLDALRSFAMLLGLVLHSCVYLIPLEIWPVHEPYAFKTDPATNPYLLIVLLIHGFRMPIFFLLSGFFIAMLWQKKGMKYLLYHRYNRIVLPLLVSTFTIVPICIWLFAPDQFDPLRNWHIAWRDGFAHLWFLWYLVWITLAFVIVASTGANFRHSIWWLLIPLTIISQYFMDDIWFGPQNPPNSIFPSPILLLYYAGFLFFGSFFYFRNFQVRRWWTIAIAIALVLFIPGLKLISDADGMSESATRPIWFIAALLQAAFAWCMCFGFMGLFICIAHRDRTWVRYLSDSSYFLYIAHLPLIVSAQYLAVSWPINVHVKAPVIFLGSVAVLLVLYQFCVRHTIVGAMLNGKR